MADQSLISECRLHISLYVDCAHETLLGDLRGKQLEYGEIFFRLGERLGLVNVIFCPYAVLPLPLQNVKCTDGKAKSHETSYCWLISLWRFIYQLTHYRKCTEYSSFHVKCCSPIAMGYCYNKVVIVVVCCNSSRMHVFGWLVVYIQNVQHNEWTSGVLASCEDVSTF